MIPNQTQIEIEKNQVRQDAPITKIQLLRKIWPIGFITFGGPMSHVGVFRKIFIDDLQCISNQKFTQLLTLCQSLPGPTSTQLVISLSMYSTYSWLGGLLAFVIFSLPTYIIMSISALLLLKFSNIDTQLCCYQRLQQVLAGFRIISVAIILQAFWNLSQKFRKSSRTVFLFIIATMVYYYLQSSLTIFIMFILGGIFNLLTEKDQPSEEENAYNNRFNSCPYGLKNIFLYFIGLGLSFYIILSGVEENLQIVWATFYRIGSLVIGGGHVILPLMWSQLEQYNYFSQSDYWNGFSVISCMPGPMFNLSVYIGTISAKSLLGGLAAFLGLYIPCFLFISLALPIWQQFRKGSKIKKFLGGVCCVSIGLILATCIILYQKVIENTGLELAFTILIIFSFILLYRKLSIVAVLLFGEIIYLSILGISSQI